MQNRHIIWYQIKVYWAGLSAISLKELAFSQPRQINKLLELERKMKIMKIL